MTSKTPVTLVKPNSSGIQPPRPLGNHGVALWDKLMAEYRITDCGGLEVLAQICAALDRAEMLAEQVAADGSVIMTKTGLREHPAIKGERGCRSFVTRNLQRLGLNVEAVKPVGRPGGGLGWRGND